MVCESCLLLPRFTAGDWYRTVDATIRFVDGAGTFLAGVLLAESEFRHELEIAIEPF